MENYRYFLLSEPDWGTWPDDLDVRPGSVIRVTAPHGAPAGPCVWNDATKEWVCAEWVETTDPRSENNSSPSAREVFSV